MKTKDKKEDKFSKKCCQIYDCIMAGRIWLFTKDSNIALKIMLREKSCEIINN